MKCLFQSPEPALTLENKAVKKKERKKKAALSGCLWISSLWISEDFKPYVMDMMLLRAGDHSLGSKIRRLARLTASGVFGVCFFVFLVGLKVLLYFYLYHRTPFFLLQVTLNTKARKEEKNRRKEEKKQDTDKMFSS